jgi:hypothetical protein
VLVVDEQAVPKLDARKIAFPSDSITLGQMRQMEPEYFSSLSNYAAGRLYFLDALVADELVIAERAFDAACGHPDRFPEYGVAEQMHSLNQEYKRWGVSTGWQMTRQLVRDLQKSAQEQAKQYLGQSR